LLERNPHTAQRWIKKGEDGKRRRLLDRNPRLAQKYETARTGARTTAAGKGTGGRGKQKEGEKGKGRGA
jgi:hypothetical protein